MGEFIADDIKGYAFHTAEDTITKSYLQILLFRLIKLSIEKKIDVGIEEKKVNQLRDVGGLRYNLLLIQQTKNDKESSWPTALLTLG